MIFINQYIKSSVELWIRNYAKNTKIMVPRDDMRWQETNGIIRGPGSCLMCRPMHLERPVAADRPISECRLVLDRRLFCRLLFLAVLVALLLQVQSKKFNRLLKVPLLCEVILRRFFSINKIFWRIGIYFDFH